MNQHLEEPLQLKRLCETYMISRRQVERMFARHMGSSPKRYYVQLRLERAYQLCEQTEVPIVEIAIATGFQSASVFSIRFKQTYNISPRELRANLTFANQPVSN